MKPKSLINKNIWNLSTKIGLLIIIIHNIRFFHLYFSGILPWQETILSHKWYGTGYILMRLSILIIGIYTIKIIKSHQIYASTLVWLSCTLLLSHEVDKYLFLCLHCMVILNITVLYLTKKKVHEH